MNKDPKEAVHPALSAVFDGAAARVRCYTEGLRIEAIVSLCLALVTWTGGCNRTERSEDRATAKQCDDLAAKYAVLAAKHMSDGVETEGEPSADSLDEITEALVRSMTSSTKKSCLESFDRSRVECALAAPDLEAMVTCEPTVDLRPHAERPGPDECQRLGAHLESLYGDAIKPLGADPGEREVANRKFAQETAATIVAGSVRECSLTTTKGHVDCQMRAETIPEVIQCSPVRLDTSELDEAIDKKLIQPIKELEDL